MTLCEYSFTNLRDEKIRCGKKAVYECNDKKLCGIHNELLHKFQESKKIQ